MKISNETKPKDVSDHFGGEMDQRDSEIMLELLHRNKVEDLNKASAEQLFFLIDHTRFIRATEESASSLNKIQLNS